MKFNELGKIARNTITLLEAEGFYPDLVSLLGVSSGLEGAPVVMTNGDEIAVIYCAKLDTKTEGPRGAEICYARMPRQKWCGFLSIWNENIVWSKKFWSADTRCDNWWVESEEDAQVAYDKCIYRRYHLCWREYEYRTSVENRHSVEVTDRLMLVINRLAGFEGAKPSDISIFKKLGEGYTVHYKPTGLTRVLR